MLTNYSLIFREQSQYYKHLRKAEYLIDLPIYRESVLVQATTQVEGTGRLLSSS